MKARNLFAIILLFFFSLIINQAGALTTAESVMSAFNFDNDNISGTNLYDLTGQDNNGTLDGGVSTGEVGVINQSVDVQLTERILMPDMPQLAPGYQKPFSFSVWINVSDITQNMGVFHFADATVGNHHTNMFVTTNSGSCPQGAGNGRLVYVNSKAGTYDNYTCSDSLLTNNNWYHVVVTYDNETRETAIYVNGSLDYSQYDGFDSSPAAALSTSRLAERTNALQGRMDEWAAFNFTLSPTQVSTLYNGGAGLAYPYPGLFTNASEDLRGSSAIIRNPDSVRINSVTYQPVVQGLYYHDEATEIYLSAGFDFIPGNPITSTCQILINGTSYSEASRTSSAAQNGEPGNVYFVTQNISLAGGVYELTLQCLKVGGGFYDVNNSYIFLNDFYDHGSDEILNYQYYSQNFTGFPSASFDLLDDIAFTINQTANGSGSAEKHIMIDGYVEFDYDSDGFLNFTMQTPDTFGYTHHVLARYGTAGSTGNGAYFTVNITATPNASGHVGIRLFGKSTTNDGAMNISLMMTELNVPRAEIGRADTDMVDYSLDTGDFKYITDVVVENNQLTNLNLIYNVYNAIRSNSGTATSYLQVRLNDSTNGSIRPRYYTGATQDGVTSFKDLFEVAPGHWNVSLWGYCDNSDCTIQTGQLITYMTEIDQADVTGFKVFANDTRGNILQDFNVTLASGSIFPASNGNATVFSNLALDNFTVQAFDAFPLSVTDHNTSLNYSALLVHYFTFNNISYSGNNTNVTNWVRNLTATINLTCFDSGNTYIDTYINDTLVTSDMIHCQNASALYVLNVTSTFEGNSTVNYKWNVSYNSSYNTDMTNESFFWDIQNPTIVFNYASVDGFGNDNVNLTMTCTDTAFSPLLYNMTFNGYAIVSTNYTSGFNYSNTSEINTTTSNGFASCSDLFGQSNDTLAFDIFKRTLLLIDERTGNEFDVSNLTNVRIFVDDNSTFYDMKGNATAKVNVTLTNFTKIRAELEYSDGAIINRYIDITLANTSNTIRICANTEGTTHFEQSLLSAGQRPVAFQSVFANCFIALDYTRFAFENSFLLPAFTIATAYQLYTFDDQGDQVFLASIDGASATFINLDTLEFNLQTIDIGVLQDGIVMKSMGDNSTYIKYTNLGQSNTGLTVQIKRMDTDTLLLNQTPLDPNNFELLFDWSTLTGVNQSTQFLITLLKDRGGSVETEKAYFNTLSTIGRIASGLALIIAILLTLFGLTFAATKFIFSWFGIVLTLSAIVVLSLSTFTWYIIFMMGMDAIILIYLTMGMFIKNQGTVG